MTYNNTMNYTYKTFTFICFALSAVTKEMAIKVAPDNSIELFDDILYQRLDNVDDNVQNIYFAWSLIRQIIADNESLLYRPYKKVIDNILYGESEYELMTSPNEDLLKDFGNLISKNKEMFKTFYDMGALRCLNELIND